MSRRPVIVHYHLFKNAGTSVDEILQKNFPRSWVEFESPKGHRLPAEELLKFIRDNPKIEAVSSHTAVLSDHRSEDIDIIPLIFLRHPIDRIRSAYDFERQQDADTPGAIQAKQGDFSDYLTWRLSRPTPWQVQNFHAMRLKDYHGFTPAKKTDIITECAHQAIETLPHVGLVEHFDRSMEIFRDIIGLRFRDFEVFPVQANRTTQRGVNLQRNLAKFVDRVGLATFEKLVELNRIDLALYATLRRRFA